MIKSNSSYDRLLTPQGVAALLSLNIQTLAAWRHLQKGPDYIKIGGAVRYRLSDLENWLKHKTVCHGATRQRQW